MNSLENKFPFSQLRLVAAIGLFAATQSLYASEIAGRVNFVSGNAFVTTPQNQQRNVFKGDLIYAGEKIETARNSRIQIKMTDGGTIVLRPSSTFEITQYSFSKDTPELGTVLYNFIKGGARAVSGAIGKVNKQNYKFNTPIATIGIRGTDYSATLDNDKLTTTVTDGKININNPQGDEDADEGETYVTYPNKKPVLCHTINKETKKPITETCEPVFISLDAEESLTFAKQKVKKPTLENYATYGAFTEAMRRYKSLEQEIERIENEMSVSNIDSIVEKSITPIANPSSTPFFQTELSGFDNLDNNELSDFSVENAIGIIGTDFFGEDNNQGLITEINKKDILLKKVFKYGLDEESTETTSKIASQLADAIDFEGFVESLFLLNNDTLYGNNMRMQGVEIGNPKVNVQLGNSIFDAINVQLEAATRNKSYALNLGLNDNTLLDLLDSNDNNKYGGLLSIRQVAIYDRDGLPAQKTSGGFLQIGSGSATDSILVLTDDNAPIKASLDLVDIQRTPSSFGFSDLTNKNIINVNLQTPKLLIKLGSVYVGGFNTVTDQETDAVASINDAADSSFKNANLIKILEPSQIVIGEATISARLEHTPLRKTNRIDDINVNPNLSIFADASIKSGVSVYNFDLCDAGGSLRGGCIGFSKVSISDYNSQNLTAKLGVYIETDSSGNNKLGLYGGNVDGLVIVLDQVGTADNGIDLNISNFRVGSQTQKQIGDVQIKGLNINGTKVIIRGH